MILFQWIVLPILALVILRELVRGRRHAESYLLWFLRIVVWLGAGVAIARPNSVGDIAQWLGIGLGVNLVVYLFALFSIVTAFYFYSRGVRMQRQITELARHIALQEVRRGEETN